MNLASTTKKILAAAVAALMILSFVPMTQENAYAAKAKKPAKVTGVKIKVSKANKVTVTWKKAKNAKKYNVSIKDGITKFTGVKSVKGTKLSFKGGNAVKYTVKVQGVNGKVKGSFSKAASKKTNDLLKAAQDELDKANGEKEKAEAALKEEQESVDDVGRSTQKEGSMHVVYSSLGMFRTDDANTTITAKDENTVTVAIKLVPSTSVGSFEKLAFAKMGEEADAETIVDLTVTEEGTTVNKQGETVPTYTATCTFDIPASKVGKKIPYSLKYKTEEGWHTFAAQPYMVVLTEAERAIYKEIADLQAVSAVQVAIAKISNTAALKYADIADIDAARAAYEALTDEQKLLVSDLDLDALEAAEDAKEDLVEIHEAIETASTCELQYAEGWNTPSELFEAPTVTLDGEEFCVVARNDELKKALLIIKGAYGEPMSFGEEGAFAYYDSRAQREEVESDVTGAWKYSPIRTLLNEDFLEEHPNVAKQAVTTVLHNKHIMLDKDGEEQVVDDVTKDKVFLPSTNDAYRMASSGAGADTEDIPASGQPGAMVNYTTARNIVIDGEAKTTAEYQWWTRNCYNWSSSENYDNSANAVYVYTPNGSGAWDYGLYGNHKNAVETKCYVRPMFWFSLED